MNRFNLKTNKNETNFLGLLGLIFVTLKLCNVIDWNWFIVTLPFWGIFASILFVIIIILIIDLFKKVINFIKKYYEKKRSNESIKK